MAKGRNIKWSQRATRDTDAIVEYLRENWTEKEADKFFSQLRKFTDVVIAFPEAFPRSQKGKLRKAVISKQNSVIYRVRARFIEIVTIIDNRSDHPY